MEQEAPKSKRNATGLFIVLVLTLLGMIVFFYFKSENLEKENAAQAIELNRTLLQLDSISTELDSKILTISQLGGEIDTLLRIKEQLQEEKKALLTNQQNQRELIGSLRDKVEGYQELLVAKDEEIKQLQLLNEQLLSENTELKTEKEVLKESIAQIEQDKSKLQEKVAFASRLKVEGLKVFAVSGSKEKESEFRNRQIEQLKIVFTVAENKVAPIEGKQLLIRILAPDGNVLFDVARGSGSFKFEGRELFFTAKQDILYDKSSQKVSLLYDKGSEYMLGKHQVEVYTDEYLMGTGTFTVK